MALYMSDRRAVFFEIKLYVLRVSSWRDERKKDDEKKEIFMAHKVCVKPQFRVILSRNKNEVLILFGQKKAASLRSGPF